MDKMLLKRTAFQSVALMLAVITLSFAFRQYQAVTILASDTTASDDSSNSENLSAPLEETSGNSDGLQPVSDQIPAEETPQIMKLMTGLDPEILSQMSGRYLVIKKPVGSDISYQIEDLYITKSIRITLSGLSGEDMNSLMIGRMYKDMGFVGDPRYIEHLMPELETSGDTLEPDIIKDYGNDIVHNITISNYYDDQQKFYKSELLLELDSVYVPIVQEDKTYYYIELKKPKDVYDKVLVIDAGHGGKDSGALSQGETYYEKNFNLGILLELKKMLDKENIKVYYTRTGDDKVFLKPREELANAVDCDYFISIHCNASEAEWPKGSEVMYYDREFKGVRNKDLANLFLDELSKTIPLETRYITEKKKDEIYILKKAVVPAVLIEVGYITNNSDMKYLSKEENRKAAAQGIYNGIMKAYEMYPPTDGELREAE